MDFKGEEALLKAHGKELHAFLLCPVSSVEEKAVS